MARYETDNRETLQFFSGSLDDLLPSDSVARPIWAGLQKLDFGAFDDGYDNDAVGRPAVDPRSLTAVWTLGLLRGVTSSVRLATLCERDIEFRWLLGDARVEKSTLCAFRKQHKAELAALCAQVLSALGGKGLLPGKHMGVDGTIVRAAASRHASKSRRRLEKNRQCLQGILEQKLSQMDEGAPSAEIQALQQRQARVNAALAELDAQGKSELEAKITVTEPEARVRKQKDGSYAPGYNAQAVMDLDSGVMVSAEIVDTGNDTGQLQPQVTQAQAVFDALPCEPPRVIESVTADSAYHETQQLHALETNGVCCYVPDDRNTHRQAPGIGPGFQVAQFTYDETRDVMRCPMGRDLKRRGLNPKKTSAVYQASYGTCQACPAKPQCCPGIKSDRCVSRPLPVYKETLDLVADRLDTEEGRQKRHARWVANEGVFARLNGLLHWKRNRMWRRAGAEMELLWRQFAHNLMLLTGIWKPLISATP